ncbi:MAG: methyltransferase [Mycobacterium sp.]|nr:methyltransferase [Mycobacterium sp.]
MQTSWRKRVARRLPPNVVAALQRFRYGTAAPFRRRLAGIPQVGAVDMGDLRRLTPISRISGRDRGTPVDRYYIERFLEDNCSDIHGRVLEIRDDTYSRRYGGDRVVEVEVLSKAETAEDTKATIIADLSNAPQIASEQFDAIIFTQTLQFIYDAPAAIDTLYRLLKPGGVLLMTVPGTTSAGLAIAELWSFTERSVRALLTGPFHKDDISTVVGGNVLAAMALLQGLSHEELGTNELEYLDPDYPVIIAARAVKTGRTA